MSFINSLFKKDNVVRKSPSRPVFSDLLEAIREGVIIVDSDTRIVASNNSAYDAFGRGNGALETKRLSEVIRESSVHEAFRNALEMGETSEIKFEFLDKEKLVFSVRVSPYITDDSKKAIGTFYNLTKIERLENIRQEFLSNVSHELRTPLTSILAFVETLEDGALDDQENNRRFLGIIRSNAERMQYLLNDILELSAIEAGKVNVEKRPIRLSALVEEVFMNLSAKAKSRKIVLKNEIPAGQTISADVIRMEQILTNLIDNAVKFSREGGNVTLLHESRNGRDLIHVRDEGEGIPAEHLPRLFERFYRTDRARSREIGGTGLGLAIVKHLARLHNGEASVASTPGKGSTFTIELPSALDI